MPVQNTDRNSTWLITSDGDTWTLAKSAKITTTTTNGIDESGHSGSTIKVFGDIEVSATAAGVSINGSDSSLFVGGDSLIKAKQSADGIYSAAAGAAIENHGHIDAGNAAIRGAIWSNVDNYGFLEGKNYGIWQEDDGSQIYNYARIEAGDVGILSGAGGTYIGNGKDGVIDGGERGIVLNGSGAAEILNLGILRGDQAALESGASLVTVINKGKIFGDVLLGGGEDDFDSRKGSVTGEVVGGDGDDEYYLGASKVKIVEEGGAGSGDDLVYTTVSYKLAPHIERLSLLGTGDIDGTGNKADNVIEGNSGDNVVKGAAGMDYLFAKGGDDMLFGGGAQDRFIFSGGGVDRVKDFKDGTDLVVIVGVDNQSEFDALDIKQVHGDTVINLGGGDRIIIEDVLKSDFNYSDIGHLV